MDSTTASSPAAPATPAPTAVDAYARYERVRIGGRTGLSFFRCIDCRALIEEVLAEQRRHDDWHTRLHGPGTTSTDDWTA